MHENYERFNQSIRKQMVFVNEHTHADLTRSPHNDKLREQDVREQPCMDIHFYTWLIDTQRKSI